MTGLELHFELKKRGITLRDVADAMQVSITFVHYAIYGKRTSRMAKKVKKYCLQLINSKKAA